VVIAQIEHYRGAQAIDEILAVDGIDGFIIGPYDLSCSLGKPGIFDTPEFLAAIEAVGAGGRRAAKPGGLHVVEPDPVRLEKAMAEGHRFNAYGVDFKFIDVAARAGVSHFRKRLNK
jgi:2-dehydro-3-deoxyglucarate aldolase